MARIRLRRGTRVELDALAAGEGLLAGEPLFIVDEGLFAVATGPDSYVVPAGGGGDVLARRVMPDEDGDVVTVTQANDHAWGHVHAVLGDLHPGGAVSTDPFDYAPVVVPEFTVPASGRVLIEVRGLFYGGGLLATPSALCVEIHDPAVSLDPDWAPAEFDEWDGETAYVEGDRVLFGAVSQGVWEATEAIEDPLAVPASSDPTMAHIWRRVLPVAQATPIAVLGGAPWSADPMVEVPVTFELTGLTPGSVGSPGGTWEVWHGLWDPTSGSAIDGQIGQTFSHVDAAMETVRGIYAAFTPVVVTVLDPAATGGGGGGG